MLNRRTLQVRSVSHQQLVDVARARREQHLPGQRADERGQHEGNQEQQLHGVLEGQVGARDQPGKEDANDRAEEGHPGGDDQRVLQRLVGIRLAQDQHDVLDIELRR